MHTNHLINEKSPYLQQHAHNPVDWYPWGEDAFAKARREDKPIFLSVGYSTCHWCHVMERESFESEEIATILNASFVPIKVDREERPDVDRIYMMFIQATTGGGGWPMSVWLTPDLKPFFGGTYFPPEDRQGHPGFGSVLKQIADAWASDREKIVQSGADVLSQLRRYSEITARQSRRLDQGLLDSAYSVFRRTFDPKLGGFGGAPKFPRPCVYNFLLRYYALTGNQEAAEMVLATLEAMARGGIHDQLGGGFHRYSVDARWFVPHFEKMLYDQAQLAVSYLEAFQLTGAEYYSYFARDILDYVLRDMTSPEGAFYSAEDADSVIDTANPEVKGEGAFYLWTQAEIEAALGQPAAERFCYHYGVRPEGNVEEDPHGEFTGKNILSDARMLEETAQQFGISIEEAHASLDESRKKLLEARSRRIRPHLDDKIITAWNGLMISAFAKAAQALDDERYLAAAQCAAGFLLTRMVDEHGVLLRRYREGEAAVAGFLDDYAFLVQALLDLYEADFDVSRLEQAIRLADRMRELFDDPQLGAFFSTAADAENLVVRMKDGYDGAEPSGNSIAALDLLRLAAITGRKEYRDSAEWTLEAFGGRMESAAAGVPQILVALWAYLEPPKQIILAGQRPECRNFLRAVNRRFVPNRVLLLANPEARDRLSAWQPAIAGMGEVDGKPTAYVCRDYACELPTTDVKAFEQMLDAGRKKAGSA